MKKNCLFVWNVLDPIYYQFTRLNYIKNNVGERTIIRVRLTRYKGRDAMLQDGTAIRKNDLLLKIHLHNVRLLNEMQSYNSDIRRALVTYKCVKDALPSLAHYIQSNGNMCQVKGLVGITTLHKGCKTLGFEVYPIKNKYYKWFKQIALFPIHLLSSRTIKKEYPAPMYLMMSVNNLIKKYGSENKDHL
nr:hypothetical protein [Oceanobacillus senegalensis]